MIDKMDSEINVKNLLDLLSLADMPADPSDDAPITRAAAALRDGVKSTYAATKDTIADTFAKIKTTGKGKTDEAGDAKEKEKVKAVQTVINVVVRLVSDLVQKVNAQGQLLKDTIERQNKSPSDDQVEELKQQYETLEADVRRREEDLQKTLDEKRDILEKDFESKLNDLEIKCDEGRQREMKGTLIVSSPVRGSIPTEAFPRSHYWPERRAEMESELDMVLRMVQEKTGVRFHYSDVVACHRIGKRDSNSFVLKIGNRQPNSAWDMLTSGMKTGKSFSRQNIFINFMLTSRRTEVSKQLRKVKKDGLIDKYSIDQNGRFFIKKNGDDPKFHEVVSVKDIEKFTKKS